MKKYLKLVLLITLFCFSFNIYASPKDKLKGKWLDVERYAPNGIAENIIDFTDGTLFRDKNRHKSKISFDKETANEKVRTGWSLSPYEFIGEELHFQGRVYIKYDKRMEILSDKLPDAAYENNLKQAKEVVDKYRPVHQIICDRTIKYANGTDRFGFIKLLKKEGCNVDRAMYQSLSSGEIDIVKYLIDNGFDINEQDSIQGRSLIMYAINTHPKHFGIVEYIMQKKPDLSIKDFKDKDVYQAMRHKGTNREIAIGLLQGKKLIDLEVLAKTQSNSPAVNPYLGANTDNRKATGNIDKLIIVTPPAKKSGGCLSVNNYKPVAGLVNLALHKHTSQSSTYFYKWNASSDLANDGNTDGKYMGHSVMHTRNNNHAWWQVDLEKRSAIKKIVLWNRTDPKMEKRLTNFSVYVIDKDKKVVFENIFCQNNNIFSPAMEIVLPENTSGRYVKVMLNGQNYLHLAEVEVFGN